MILKCLSPTVYFFGTLYSNTMFISVNINIAYSMGRQPHHSIENLFIQKCKADKYSTSPAKFCSVLMFLTM